MELRNSGVVISFVAVLLASSLIGLASNANQIDELQLMIAIDYGTDDGPVFLGLDGADAAFEFDDLQLGETRSIVDQQGRSILVTRTENGFELDVDGKRIDLPAFDSLHPEHWWPGEGHEDVHVNVTRSVRIEQTTDDITIISTNEIDDATKDKLRSILTSSGHRGDVVFLEQHHDVANSAHDADQRHRIKIISKEVNATN